MGEIRQFSKVREVIAVKRIKINDIANPPLARVFGVLMLRDTFAGL